MYIRCTMQADTHTEFVHPIQIHDQNCFRKFQAYSRFCISLYSRSGKRVHSFWLQKAIDSLLKRERKCSILFYFFIVFFAKISRLQELEENGKYSICVRLCVLHLQQVRTGKWQDKLFRFKQDVFCISLIKLQLVDNILILFYFNILILCAYKSMFDGTVRLELSFYSFFLLLFFFH